MVAYVKNVFTENPSLGTVVHVILILVVDERGPMEIMYVSECVMPVIVIIPLGFNDVSERLASSLEAN